MTIVFATSNENKIKEVQNLLPQTITIIGLKEIGCYEEIPETSDTIAGNALQKATYIFEQYNVPCFADDTGLEVNSLNGEPGVLSARYAGNERDNKKNIEKLLSELHNKKDRSAQFKTVIAVAGLDNEPVCLEGICKGAITTELIGNNGFGYDPIFRPINRKNTFAEMSLSEKNQISHRGKAVSQLIEYLISR